MGPTYRLSHVSHTVGRTTQRLQERIEQHVPKTIKKRTTVLRSREPINPNQPEFIQIENAKQKVRLNSNQRAIPSMASICWNPISAHATILIRGLNLNCSWFLISLEPVGSGSYFTKKKQIVLAKAIRIYPLTVSIRSEPAVTI